MTYTVIDEVLEDGERLVVVSCDDCGAFDLSDDSTRVAHYPTCKPGSCAEEMRRQRLTEL